MSKLFVVGDSTLSVFNDSTYLYPRYGYATQLNKFYDIEIINLALSGRSSKSFTLEENYKILWDNIKENDFLLIGFGHNDEKSDDLIRFTDASLPIDNEKSFKYSLYNNYIKIALEKGVIPILSTPIVRLDPTNAYKENIIHQTIHGDYRLAIIELAKSFNITCADLTTRSLELMKDLSPIEQKYHHAIVAGVLDGDKIIPDFRSIDKAHLSYYGAYYIAYLFSLEIGKTNNKLNYYFKPNAKIPDEKDIISNPAYKIIKYKTPDLINYKPNDEFICSNWYGTAFGDTDVLPNIPSNGFVAKEYDNGFLVGQPNNYGKIHASVDAMSLVFKQIPISKNFILKANAKIISFNNVKQSAFGLILRDDCYINQSEASVRIATNYVASGFLTTDSSTHIIFSRSEPTDLAKGNNVLNEYYQIGDEAYLEIERLGQLIATKVIYKGITYSRNYFDFDLVATDGDFMYAGMFATKGIVVKYDDVEFTITGDAKEA